MKQLSKKNDYYLPKDRYFELKYFALQYPEWKRKLVEIDRYRSGYLAQSNKGFAGFSDPTLAIVLNRATYLEKTEMVERAVHDAMAFNNAPSCLYKRLMDGVTKGVSYDILNSREIMPVSRAEYYKIYRMAFFNLHILRS